jgi:hypothetical protein
MKANPLIANPLWTAKEGDLLHALAESGEPPAAMPERPACSPAAVRRKFYKLGIPLKRTRVAGLGGKEFTNYYERQFMEYLRGRDGSKGRLCRRASRSFWASQRRDGSNAKIRIRKKEAFYRMTDAGLAALKAPAPLRQGWTDQQKYSVPSNQRG